MTPAFEIHLGRDPETHEAVGVIYIKPLGLDVLDLMRNLKTEYPELWSRVGRELPLSIEPPHLNGEFPKE